jgi:predicted house-cleaning noncanonical NTP pyrophosphatase (MazG superfamily)
MAKLVRDLISDIIRKNGKKPITHIADESEYWDKLRLKIREEINEFLEAKTDDEIKEELADVLEVINAICEFKKIDKKELEFFRVKKSQERGGFSKKVILEKVE